jgi:hypothetical protein
VSSGLGLDSKRTVSSGLGLDSKRTVSYGLGLDSKRTVSSCNLMIFAKSVIVFLLAFS